jgi:hypothetical protein
MNRQKSYADVVGARRAHGVSDVECGVLVMVGRALVVEPRHLAQLAYGQDQRLAAHPPLAEYEAAVSQLCDRALLRVLSEAECDAERRRLLAWTGPRVPSIDDWRPGWTVFTAAGFELHCRMVGPDYAARNCHGWRVDDAARLVEFAAATRETCQELLDDVVADPAAYLGHPARIDAVESPRECGPWLPSHHEEADRGWAAVLRFEMLPDARDE